MNSISREVRILNCVMELIEDSVNYVVCTFIEDEDGLVIQVNPKDIIEKKYYFILLLEMFSFVNLEMVPGKSKDDNLLILLQKITSKPSLNTSENDVKRLSRRTIEFIEWLEKGFKYELYSQEIGKNIVFEITRKEVLYLVGNRCKHTLVRSNEILKKLVRKYREAGTELNIDEETLVLVDIDNWLFENFCGYHFTKICELYSNLYHSIIEYIRPVYVNTLRIKNEIQRYEMPEGLTRLDYQTEFYNLMNKVNNPWIPYIETPEILSKRY